MAGSAVRPNLHVEGRDDKWSIANVMLHHGVDYDQKPWPFAYPEIKDIGNIDDLLNGIETAVAAASGNTVGFVVDADKPLRSRWDAVRARLQRVDVHVPILPPRDGFIGRSNRFKSRVGIWLMPDNERDGILEDFLQELVSDNDALIAHAEAATDRAKQIAGDAAFQDVDRSKAIVHSWLAWQKEPGLPFGTAIRAKFFRADLPAAQRFANWFKTLFGVTSD